MVLQATVAESPAQLFLEAAAAKQWGTGNAPNSEPAKAVAKIPSAKSTETAKAVLKVLSAAPSVETAKAVPKLTPVVTNTDTLPKAVPKVANGAAAAAPLPVKAVTKAPSAAALNGSLVPTSVPQARVNPSPVKQTEYRRADGRRRIIPEPLGPPRGDDIFGNGALHSNMADLRNQGEVGTSSFVETAPKRKLPDEYSAPPAKRSNGEDASYAAARSTPAAAVVAIGVGNEGPPNIAGVGSQVDIVVPAERMTTPEGVLSIRIRGPDSESAPICLEARPADCSTNPGTALGSASIRESSAKAKIVCSQSGEVRWCDYLVSMPTALAGNCNFWAVACGDGSLQVMATISCTLALLHSCMLDIIFFMVVLILWKGLANLRWGSLQKVSWIGFNTVVDV